MEPEPISILQLPLFAYGETITNVVELFPAVWKATEALTSPDASIRKHGIDSLIEVGAQRVSPLVAYMLATCLQDADIDIRKKIAWIVADLLFNDSSGQQAAGDVIRVLTHYLKNIREETITGLLEISIEDSKFDTCIFHILNACPYGGKYLGEILSQWKNSLAIRQKAIYFAGLVGYTDAKPALERLFNRLDARQNGQYLMDFAPPGNKSDDDLLPYLRIALNQLYAR